MGILVVDDQVDNSDLVKCILESAGYSGVVTVSSAEQAFDYLRGGALVDLILMDFCMPDMDGIAACKRLKADPALEDIPVIVVTARGESDVLDRAFAAGATDFVRKPFDPVELCARVRTALALKAQIDHRKARERELAEANRQLDRLARIDALTGVANRRALDETLVAEWRRATRTATWLSLVIVDIDFFKAYNDTYGHPAGDAILARVARLVERELRRPADFAARFGGEEFVVLLPETSLEGAVAVAERIRAEVEAVAILHASSNVAPVVTISAGVASAAPAADFALSSLVERADRALYEAKAAGRNRVRCAPAVRNAYEASAAPHRVQD
jgi:diguanylate cyclase (GGDEF)-like protein